MKDKILTTVTCNTVGELLDALSEIAENPALSSVLDASLESQTDVFGSFQIIERRLSDKSKVLEFELVSFKLESE